MWRRFGFAASALGGALHAGARRGKSAYMTENTTLRDGGGQLRLVKTCE